MDQSEDIQSLRRYCILTLRGFLIWQVIFLPVSLLWDSDNFLFIFLIANAFALIILGFVITDRLSDYMYRDKKRSWKVSIIIILVALLIVFVFKDAILENGRFTLIFVLELQFIRNLQDLFIAKRNLFKEEP